MSAQNPLPLALSRALPGPGFVPYAKGMDWALHRGDAVELLSAFPRASVDLCFVDPPYFLSNGGTTVKGGQRVSVEKGEWDASKGFGADVDFHTRWLTACRRLLKPTGTLWASGTMHAFPAVSFAAQRLGYHVLNIITWYKPNASPNLSCRFFTHSTELLLWAAPHEVEPLPHIFNDRAMRLQNLGTDGKPKQMRDVWNLPKPGEEELQADGEGRLWTCTPPGEAEKEHGKHPTQKPVRLLERIIEASSEPGAVVLDPFNGSGTTGLAALKLGRRYVGIDLEEQYLELTRKRLEAVQSGR
jgi:site-specific DNA-methyltransferase (adenine-specific)